MNNIEEQPEEGAAYLQSAIPAVQPAIISAQPGEGKEDEVDFTESIQEVLNESDGLWQPCSGCHETVEGQEVGHNSYSKMFKSYVGSGCHECGGIGVVWNDYSETPSSSHQASAGGPAGEKQSFESFPELVNIIEWCANNVSIPGTKWNILLNEINKVCAIAVSTPPPSNSASIEQRAEATMFMKGGNTDNEKDYYKLGYIAGASSQPDMKEIVEKLRKDNPYAEIQFAGDAWAEACNKFESILKQNG